ncbi:MAG TPA: hypothetical protein VGF94_17935 [Kofleriaceae bacterium]
MSSHGTVIAGVLALVGVPASARADEGRLLGDDTFAVHSDGPYLVDGGLFVGMPAALPAGMTTGFGAGITRECGCVLSYGLRASWSEENETDDSWSVTHQDIRLRAVGALHHTFGRGTLALRLGAGTTIVHETRDRQQAMRMMMGDAETHAVAALPAADLEAVVALHVAGPWLLVASAGPSIDVLDSNVRGGWVAQLGVGWEP